MAARNERATFECANGVVQRPTHRNTTWDQAMYEAAAHRFIDLSEPGFGVALLNNGQIRPQREGQRARRLSLLRSPIYPDPLADEGEQSFTYALLPHAGDWHEGGVREEAGGSQPAAADARGARAWRWGAVTPLAGSAAFPRRCPG